MALLFTIFNALVLIERLRAMHVRVDATDFLAATVLNLAALGFGVAAVVAPTAATLEWLLVVLIARPGAAFLLALGAVTGG